MILKYQLNCKDINAIEANCHFYLEFSLNGLEEHPKGVAEAIDHHVAEKRGCKEENIDKDKSRKSMSP